MLNPNLTDGGFIYKPHAILLKGNLTIESFWKAWLKTSNQRPKSKSSPEASIYVFTHLCSSVSSGPPMATTVLSTQQDCSEEYSRWCCQTFFFKRWRFKNRLHALFFNNVLHPFIHPSLNLCNMTVGVGRLEGCRAWCDASWARWWESVGDKILGDQLPGSLGAKPMCHPWLVEPCRCRCRGYQWKVKACTLLPSLGWGELWMWEVGGPARRLMLVIIPCHIKATFQD